MNNLLTTYKKAAGTLITVMLGSSLSFAVQIPHVILNPSGAGVVETVDMDSAGNVQGTLQATVVNNSGSATGAASISQSGPPVIPPGASLETAGNATTYNAYVNVLPPYPYDPQGLPMTCKIVYSGAPHGSLFDGFVISSGPENLGFCGGVAYTINGMSAGDTYNVVMTFTNSRGESSTMTAPVTIAP